MLQPDDLSRYMRAFEQSASPLVAPVKPPEALGRSSGLFPDDMLRLVNSLEAAVALGDVPYEAAFAGQIIMDSLGADRCAPLSEMESWAQALAWARGQLPSTAQQGMSSARARGRIVGEACRRLRKRGYNVRIGAYGPILSAASRRQIVHAVEGYIALLGGRAVADQLLDVLRRTNALHDGIWLFGETNLGIYQSKEPMPPVGWLLSLSLKYLGREGVVRKPDVAWKSLIGLATDFAAAHDCQRYSQFEEMHPHPSQLELMFANSTQWRELFSFPQVPHVALSRILQAIGQALTKEDEEKLGFSFEPLRREIEVLMNRSAADGLTVHSRKSLEQLLPVLHRVMAEVPGTVNTKYDDPLVTSTRTQDSIMLFSYGKDRVITLPRSFLASAVCHFLFGMMWIKLKKRTEFIIKETTETAIASACKDKAKNVLSQEKYRVGKAEYEFDVATRDDDRIVLIETKGKSLTRNSRSGDMMAFFEDYSASILRMLGQLVRHEDNLRQGVTPLTSEGERVSDFRPLKIAVSPLSYGPVADKVFLNGSLRALLGVRLSTDSQDAAHRKTIKNINEKIEVVLADMIRLSPKRDDKVDLFGYLIDVFWLDLGQTLYMLHRGRTVWDAFRPIQFVTFSTRDAWMEIAEADRRGLAARHWHPLR